MFKHKWEKICPNNLTNEYDIWSTSGQNIPDNIADYVKEMIDVALTILFLYLCNPS